MLATLELSRARGRFGTVRTQPRPAKLANIGDVLGTWARLFSDKVGARDLEREMTFRLWHQRACRLANALIGIGLTKGDRICILAYNCVEWLEIYAAAAVAGLIAVPINFRLVGTEIQYIIEDCGAKALIVQDELMDSVESVRAALAIPADRFIIFGRGRRGAGFYLYEELIANARDTGPPVDVSAEDPWTLMYTSGTTGKPKGAIRGHRGGAMLALVTDAEMGLTRHDSALLAMPSAMPTRCTSSEHFRIAEQHAQFTAARAPIRSISCASLPRAVQRSPPWYRRITP